MSLGQILQLDQGKIKHWICGFVNEFNAISDTTTVQSKLDAIGVAKLYSRSGRKGFFGIIKEMRQGDTTGTISLRHPRGFTLFVDPRVKRHWIAGHFNRDTKRITDLYLFKNYNGAMELAEYYHGMGFHTYFGQIRMV